ncbi:MAG: type I-U CRISPR-associated helicase/endonuclease Cas3 [Planctomyces sp.]|nr:type I-U CRISPR-associated helicase/endonuclease Cas3 [Planctomyces sp.]
MSPVEPTQGGSSMSLSPERFDEFFHELWGANPFPWQRRLAEKTCNGVWPEFIDLPTASGKTACLDIAIFALAVQAVLPPDKRTLGRRIYFVVNRRVIVDEANDRAGTIAQKLLNPSPQTCLAEVAAALQHVSGDTNAPPLDVAMLRGGIVRDNRWARSLTQPTVITSTVDQVGSRLLFRGYGVTPEAAPLHAALVAQDSLILLDEAHISQPFVQTLQAVRRYRGEKWAAEPVLTPFHFVQMTATPSDSDGEVFGLDDDDRQALAERHGASKPVSLQIAEKAKGKGGKAVRELAVELAKNAVELVDDQRRNVAVVVNRVATAREVHRLLQEKHRGRAPDEEPSADALLAIGRMRPLDRDELTCRIQKRVGKCRSQAKGADADARPMFVVATQCLEVGADLDFDAMISECASIDALRQRFGRLNRTGRPIDARGCIVARADQIGDEEDPIYGPALAAAWMWLNSIATEGKVDFGVNALAVVLDSAASETVQGMLAPRLDAPIMLPAYVDLWAQTSPIPTPDPDVAIFLHGPQRGDPEVNVCWRDDLIDDPGLDREEAWRQIVSLCPPSSPECMPTPLSVVRRWLSNEPVSDDHASDLLNDVAEESTDSAATPMCQALAWRGLERSQLVTRARDVHPGDTLVLPTSAEGWDVFGHKPADAEPDRAEEACRLSRGRLCLRLHPGRFADWKDESSQPLKEWLLDPDSPLKSREIRDAIQAAIDGGTLGAAVQNTLQGILNDGAFEIHRYPSGRGVVLTSRRRLRSECGPLPTMDDGDDEPSCYASETPVTLAHHLHDVRDELARSLQLVCLNGWSGPLKLSAEWHDLGKADHRFQALLLNGSPQEAAAQRLLYAKSGRMPRTQADRNAAYRHSGLPRGFRHEMLSVQLAERLVGRLPEEPRQRDLLLHLIAAHHGRARPFAPVVEDDDPPEVQLSLEELEANLSGAQRQELPPHRIDSGIAERFWLLTRCFGWWGLAYLEAILRLADQRASADGSQRSTSDTSAASE